MSLTITRAMVMAAGLGTRMAPLTETRPKALVTCCGTALIDHSLGRLAKVGVRECVVNVHHFADDLVAHLSQWQSPVIRISDERGALLETGGGLVKALPMLGAEPVFVCNIDAVLAGEPHDNFCTLAARFNEKVMDALLLLAPLHACHGYSGKGDFHLHDNGTITRVSAGDRHNALAYTGIQILHPRVLGGMSVERFSTNRIWDKLISEGRAQGVVMAGQWYHVGDPQALLLTEAALCPK